MKLNTNHYRDAINEAVKQTHARVFTKYPYISHSKGLVSVVENVWGGFSCSLVGYLPFSCTGNHLFVPVPSEIDEDTLYCELTMTFRNLNYTDYVQRVFGKSISQLDRIEMDIMNYYFQSKI